MIVSTLLATCVFAAAETYAVPPAVLYGILHVEGGKAGQQVLNKNGSYDLGPMQINTLWLAELSRYWRVSKAQAWKQVRDDVCINVGVGAWILRRKMDESGSLYQGIAHYHSFTPHLGQAYRKKVLAAMKKIRYVRPVDQDRRIAALMKGRQGAGYSIKVEKAKD